MDKYLFSMLTLVAFCLLGINQDCSSDMDGDGWTVDQGDCNDNDGTVYPGAEEVCDDRIDNDCDGEIDEDCSSGSACPMDGCWVDWWGEVFYLDRAADGTITGTFEVSSCMWEVDGWQHETTSPAVVLNIDLQGENSSCADTGTFELDWVGTDCSLLKGILYVFDMEQTVEVYPCDSGARHAAPGQSKSPLTR